MWSCHSSLLSCLQGRKPLESRVLLEQDEHCLFEGRRMFSAESMASIPALEELPRQPSLQDATT